MSMHLEHEHEQLQNFWTLDHLGVARDEVLEQDLELEVKNAIQRDKSGKYVVSLPWKPQALKKLALNKALCETRLRRKVRKITPEEYTTYDNQLKTLLKEGHIELLPTIAFPGLIFRIEELLSLIARQLNYA